MISYVSDKNSCRTILSGDQKFVTELQSYSSNLIDSMCLVILNSVQKQNVKQSVCLSAGEKYTN